MCIGVSTVFTDISANQTRNESLLCSYLFILSSLRLVILFIIKCHRKTVIIVVYYCTLFLLILRPYKCKLHII